MTSISGQLETYFKSLILNNLYVPTSFSYVMLVGLMFLSIALIFKGSTTWRFLFVALGAYYGYIFSSFILQYIPISNTPEYLVLLIGIVLGALVMTIFVKIALSAGFAALAFIILIGIYPAFLAEVLVVSVLLFALVYGLYSRITMVVAGVMGAFLLWFALIALGLTSLEGQIIAGILYPAGLYLQYIEKSRKKARLKYYRNYRYDVYDRYRD